MPKLVIGQNQNLQIKNQGFTLVELLVVMFIISIIALTIVLNLGNFRTQPYKLDDISNQFLLQIRAAQARAILKPTVIGLHLAKDEYQFSEFQNSEPPSPSFWKFMEHGNLWSYTLPENLKLQLEINGKNIPLMLKLKSTPEIVINSNGNMSNFKIQIIDNSGRFNIILDGKENGDIKMTTKAHL